ncbi:hypothetical protein HAZT_HAZT005123 [Hyalella azteca]|uniref:Endonuclease/exonuclease/phosphatase domain-containing protein n=1 Tax=Hyalella azteca TaxID=294128 RepID=A0A6A0GSE6_HYAAZ|nr:hypothetical protein HAZT_HAZT005123 [Hyalella azteca]
MGDFNFPEINWVTERCEAGPNHIASQFLKTVKNCFLIQHQREPTRFREGEKSNTVDLIFTNREEMAMECGMMAGLGKSDHLTLLVTISFVCEDPPRLNRRNFRKMDSAVLRGALAGINWQDELSGLEVDETWTKIKNKITEAIEASTPMSRTSGRKGKTWMDKDTLTIVRKKHKLFRRWQETRDGQDYQAYKKIKSENSLLASMLARHQDQMESLISY